MPGSNSATTSASDSSASSGVNSPGQTTASPAQSATSIPASTTATGKSDSSKSEAKAFGSPKNSGDIKARQAIGKGAMIVFNYLLGRDGVSSAACTFSIDINWIDDSFCLEVANYIFSLNNKIAITYDSIPESIAVPLLTMMRMENTPTVEIEFKRRVADSLFQPPISGNSCTFT